MECKDYNDKCINCHDHYQQLRPLIKEVIVTSHFERDLPSFDITSITDCRHENFTHLHKFEETIDGNHIFRALQDHTHIVYAIDKAHRLVFLRAFDNFKEYERFLSNKKKITEMIKK
ncbi:MAG: hypothetical protein NT001_00640 [Candidatus Woesearchaeota archaeon]|nr:hypothetical protein [Candidatus Woesearchaeota archaeon]